MSAVLNAQLIDAVEAGSETDVRRLIDTGASPDARKRVTLRAKVDDGKGGFEWKEDTKDCESALVLAVVHAWVGVVMVLLEKGATVDGQLDWKISPSGSQNWSADAWQDSKWMATYSFPSVLTLAIGRGGTLTSWDGNTFPRPTRKGKLDINLRGGMVTLNHPTQAEDRSVLVTVQPNVEIARLLLAYGTRVTDVELNAVERSSDPEFLRILESHQRSPTSRPGSDGP
ncbi:hypothetical protein M427DRAFT_56732 [Gonapodya prolifera JEL478]|uniref:Ankyrin n=1 Tax=Gonapodya prolifera (strain JEL478) TaxID=1344416 RepID=A0A139AF42_GONPJ|nr:hypothetical protein M427DRAFT_56732 [Gonapodya prolifera JEL478]|eukprot:KXS15370.1 hypothetical protein M427DRAFT_56732 [Gonapodya prolifera JEL478]